MPTLEEKYAAVFERLLSSTGYSASSTEVVIRLDFDKVADVGRKREIQKTDLGQFRGFDITAGY